MTKRIKPLVFLLVAALLVLMVGLIRFRYQNDQSADTPDIDKTLASDFLVFQNEETDMYGVQDAGGRIVIEPVWPALEFASDETCIAAMEVEGSLVYGMLDLEETIRIPFVYAKITQPAKNLLVAVTAADATKVLYDLSGTPLFSEAWDSCQIEGETLVLTHGQHQYTALLSKDGARMTTVKPQVTVGGFPLRFSFDEEALAKVHDYRIYPKIAELTEQYLNALLSGDLSQIYSYTSSDSYDKLVLTNFLTDSTLSQITVSEVTTDETGAVYEYSCLLSIKYQSGTTQPGEDSTVSASYRIFMKSGADGNLLLTDFANQTEASAPSDPS